MKQVLITGAEGFIGRHLYKFLENEYEVSGVDLKFGADLFYIHTLGEADTVIHLAALTNVRESFEKPDEYMRTNFLGTAHIVRLCMDYGVKLVYLSSAAAEDRSSSPYAMSKALSERLVFYFQKPTKAVVFRPYNIYGSNPPEDSLFYNYITKPQLTVYGDGTDSRDFMNVSDLCRIIKAAVDEDWQSDKPIPVGTGARHSVRSIANMFSKLKRKKIVYEPTRGGIHKSQADTTLLREFYKEPFFTNLEEDIKKLI